MRVVPGNRVCETGGTMAYPYKWYMVHTWINDINNQLKINSFLNVFPFLLKSSKFKLQLHRANLTIFLSKENYVLLFLLSGWWTKLWMHVDSKSWKKNCPPLLVCIHWKQQPQKFPCWAGSCLYVNLWALASGQPDLSVCFQTPATPWWDKESYCRLCLSHQQMTLRDIFNFICICISLF